MSDTFVKDLKAGDLIEIDYCSLGTSHAYIFLGKQGLTTWVWSFKQGYVLGLYLLLYDCVRLITRLDNA